MKQIYYCIEKKCNNKISRSTWYYGKKRCTSCANRKRKISLKTRQKMSQSKFNLNLNKYNIIKKFLIKQFIKDREPITKIAKNIGCSYSCVYKKILKYNLSRTRLKNRWNNKGENNPMFGKLGKDNPNFGKKYPKQSKRMTGRKNPMFGKIIPYKKQRYKNIWFRSSWEVKYAKYLDKNKIKWKYEPKTFDLGESTYTPDFYLPKTNKWIEIKGYWKNRAKKKFKLFKKLYPKINITVLMKKDLIILKILR